MKKELPALTGVRALAAALVFLHHYAQSIYADAPHDFGFYLLRQLNIGVNVFFVLSGFLITYRYYPLPLAWTSFRTYWWNRALRILPLYYVVLLLQILLLYLQRNSLPDVTTLVLNITLLKGLSASGFYSVMTQSWSLTVEEMFYLYAPLCFFLIKKRFLAVQVVLLLALGFYLCWFWRLQEGGQFFGNSVYMLAGTFFGRCFEFFVGVFLALLVRKQRRTERKGMAWTLGGGTLFCLLVAGLALFAYRSRISNINETVTGVALFNFFIPLSVGVLYYGLICERTWLQALLSSKVFRVCGKSSYAFYLLHIGMFAEVLFFHVTSNIVLLFVLLQLCSIVLHEAFCRPRYWISVVSSRLHATRQLVQGRRSRWQEAPVS